MKKILITGKNSYIGTSVENWLKNSADSYKIHTLDMTDPEWKKTDFSQYDSVFHVAGLAHSDTGKASEETKALYCKVNTHLTIETAQKAKDEGVRQFIFMSSAIIYGDSAPIGKSMVITKDTIPNPANFYGDSKLQADLNLQHLADERFNVAILRPPMIYGPGSKGNYPLLASFSKKFPLFPDIKNERSMLFIDNLCEFVHLMIENEETGIFFPQNTEFVNTSQLVKTIGQTHGKKVHLIRCFNPLIKAGAGYFRIINKVFGNLSYDQALSIYKTDYRVVSFEDSIRLTEKGTV